MIKQYLKGLTKLPQVLTKTEKLFLGFLTLMTLIAVIFWWRDITSFWQVKPVKGGTYTEGLLAPSTQEIDQITAKLTKIGLTYIDHKEKIQGALADHWDISADGKQYTFYLRGGLNAQEIADTYQSLPNWQDIETLADGNKIVMKLKQPFAPLLSFASEPVYNAGPYALEKQTKNEIIFSSNPSFVMGEPNLQRVVLSFFTDDRSMRAALQRQEINATDQEYRGVSGTNIVRLNLTSQDVIMFNLYHQAIKDLEIRKRIRDGQKLDKPLSLTLVTSQDPDLLKIANEFASKESRIGLTISIKSVNQIVLDRDYIINDNYDLILTTINYGYDGDPYPFWHSSQAIETGKNYSGYNSKDADRLIEEARQATDPTIRAKKYQEFNSILENDIPGIFYPKQSFSYTVNKSIKGISEGIAAVDADRFTEVWKWYIKAKKAKG